MDSFRSGLPTHARYNQPMERYELGDLLAEGGMGRVRRAWDHQLGRVVACKTLRPNLRDDPAFRRRFEREARTAARLSHPNVPAVHELGRQPDGTPYFCMRLVEGETLSRIIERLRRGDLTTHRLYTYTRRLQIVQELCDALDYAHSLGFIHRDVKPDNVMIGPFGEVQLMDWGVVRQINERTPSPAEAPACAHDTDGIVGTPAYAAPEQITGAPVDARTDVYGLGALLYEFCCLTPPFGNGPPGEVLAAVLQARPRAPEKFVCPHQGRVPREISRLILKALARRPEARFTSARELRQGLQLILEGQAPVVCPHTAYKRSLNALAAFLDNHNSPPVVAAVYLWTALPLLWAAQSLCACWP